MLMSENVQPGRRLYFLCGEEGVRYVPVELVLPEYKDGEVVEKVVSFVGVEGQHKLSEVLSRQDEWRLLYPRDAGDLPEIRLSSTVGGGA